MSKELEVTNGRLENTYVTENEYTTKINILSNQLDVLISQNHEDKHHILNIIGNNTDAIDMLMKSDSLHYANIVEISKHLTNIEDEIELLNQHHKLVYFLSCLATALSIFTLILFV